VGSKKRSSDEEQAEAWNKKNRKIFSLIVLAVDAKTLRRIHKECEDDGARAWAKICQYYQGTDKLRVNNLRTKLMLLRCDEEDDIDNYVLSVKDICEQLEIAGENQSDDDIINYIVRGLPPSYENFITMQAFAEDSQSNLIKFEEQLRAFSNHRKFNLAKEGSGRQYRLHDESALIVKQRRDKSTYNENRGRYRKFQEHKSYDYDVKGDTDGCYNCGKKGHIRKNCWAKGGGKYRQQGYKERASTATATSRKEIAFICSPSNNANSLIRTETWVIDSGATSH
jgi:hypothetical protein